MSLPAAYTYLADIAKEYLYQSGETSGHKLMSVMPAAIRGYQDMNFDVLGEIKTVRLEVDAGTRSVIVPIDYINYTKIGVERGGNLVLLTLNEEMITTTTPDSCGDPTLPEGGSKFDYSTSPTVAFYGGIGGTSYAYAPRGLNGIGYYKADIRNGRIYFNSSFSDTHIYLEYLPSGVSTGGQTIVPIMAVEAIKAFMNHWLIAQKRNVGAGEKEYAWTFYKRLKQEYNQRRNPIRFYELFDVYGENMHQGVKF